LKLEFNFNQAGVIPYRRNNGTLEILLITSVRKQKWIIPKGYVEFNLSEFESAKKEAFEEAGVKGSNETIELGSYKTKKGGLKSVKVYSMEVTEELEDYPEKNLRKRKWFPFNDAVKTIDNKEIAALMESLKSKIKK
jgi:8-oxo-dGTP pyrophosphatase MutT (NUDIX family)